MALSEARRRSNASSNERGNCHASLYCVQARVFTWVASAKILRAVAIGLRARYHAGVRVLFLDVDGVLNRTALFPG